MSQDTTDPARVLQDVETFLRRYVHFTSDEQSCAVALWVAQTWCYESFRVIPYLLITAPQKRSGKTVLLEVLKSLTFNPLMFTQPSVAVMYATAKGTTQLIDELDNMLKGSQETVSSILGIVNSGFRHDGVVPRMPNNRVRFYPVFGPKAFAMIGLPPDTLHDRSVTIKLERTATHKTVELFDTEAEDEAALVNDRLREVFTDEVRETLKKARPSIPEGITTDARRVDLWRPLFAIADHAGGTWPQRTRDVAIFFRGVASEEPGEAVQLLRDVRRICRQRLVGSGQTYITFGEVYTSLILDQDAPWLDYGYGKSISRIKVSQLLGSFNVTAPKLTIDHKQDRYFNYNNVNEKWKIWDDDAGQILHDEADEGLDP